MEFGCAAKGQKSHPPKYAWLTKVSLDQEVPKLMMEGHRGSLFLLCIHSTVYKSDHWYPGGHSVVD